MDNGEFEERIRRMEALLGEDPSTRPRRFAEVLTQWQETTDRTLARIEGQVERTNGRLSVVEKWQNGMDPVIDSLNERVDENCDEIAKQKSWQDKMDGGISARASTLVQLGILAGVVATMIKLIFFHS